MLYIPSDLVCGISAYHVLNCFIPTWVIRYPCVHLQDLVVYNYNGASTGYETFNLPAIEIFSFLLI
jgi:hypothetical protein